MRKTFLWLCVAAILLVMGGLMFAGQIHDSPTSDEPPHILSGYVFLRYGDNYIDTEHPLLAKSLAAAPLLLTKTQIDLSQDNFTRQKYNPSVSAMFTFSQHFLNYSGNSPDQILFLTRLPMLLLTLLFGVVIFLLGSKLFGKATGALATFLYATEPIVLANGPLVNTDIAAMGFAITTIYALILYAQRQSPKRLAFLTVAFTAAILSKYSTFFLFAIVVGLMLYIYKVKGERRLKHIFVMLGSTLLIIVLFYGLVSFRDRGWAGFSALTYFLGLGGTFGAIASTERFSYLLGESYTGGKLYYFPIVMATKTQVLTLVGSILGIIYLASKRLVLPKLELVIFFTPPIIFLAFAMISKFNIGLRHILPIYPFILILAAAGFVALIHNIERVFHKNLALVLTSLVLLVIFGGRLYSISSTYPHFLSYYNFIGGGTDNGWRVSDDANYDWGQDVGQLADFVRANKITSLALDNYTGLYAAKDYYNLPVKQFYPTQKDYKGWVALSTSSIVFHEDKKDNYSWLIKNHQPIARAGKSIFIFKLE